MSNPSADLVHNELRFKNSSGDVNVKFATTTTSVVNIDGQTNDYATAGSLTIAGNSVPCYLSQGRLLPQRVALSNNAATLNLSSYNNFHIYADVAISTITLNNPVTGQSGHIVIQTAASVTHSVTWQVGSEASYIKWNGGSAPTLSSTSDYNDIISYYVLSPTCVLMIASTGYY